MNRVMWVVGIVFAVVALTWWIQRAGDDDGGEGGEASASAVSHEERILASIDGEKARVNCVVRICTAEYQVEDLRSLDTRDELMDEMRDTWEVLFAGRHALIAEIKLDGETTSGSGRSSTGPILHVTCSREADRVVDWNAVDNERLEVLCDWDELVDLD